MDKLWKILLTAVVLLQLIQPVNAVQAEAGIELNVSQIGTKSTSVSMQEPHRWYIRCFFPDGEAGMQYSVLQTLSPFLSYIQESLMLSVHYPDGRENRLHMENDFTVTSGSVFVKDGVSDRLRISLTETGNAQITAGSELRISYLAELKDNAPMGTQILGMAQLNCTDPEGRRTVVLSERTAVSTGGLRICLTAPSGNPIPGGEFMVAKPTGEIEETEIREILDTGSEIISVVYVPFCDEAGNLMYTAETDQEGKAHCRGLAYGEYYLVQTRIPAGTGLPAKPVKITVSEVSDLTASDGWRDDSGLPVDHTVRVTAGSIVMPETGGPGTLGYRVSGTIVILSASLLLWSNRKRRIL